MREGGSPSGLILVWFCPLPPRLETEPRDTYVKGTAPRPRLPCLHRMACPDGRRHLARVTAQGGGAIYVYFFFFPFFFFLSFFLSFFFLGDLSAPIAFLQVSY